jgi:alkylation response protein AidB-like acyl-CoA dehydrogenase
MPIGITEDHAALHEAVRGWLERHCPPDVPRALLDAPEETRPALWGDLADQGWLGLHVDEAHGGSGYGTPELVVVLEELGRSLAPGPVLPTVLAAAIVARGGNEAAQKTLLPGLAAGELMGAVGGGPGCGLHARTEQEKIRVIGWEWGVVGG